eukprot:5684344-Prymnesium_polylepis.2
MSSFLSISERKRSGFQILGITWRSYSTRRPSSRQPPSLVVLNRRRSSRHTRRIVVSSCICLVVSLTEASDHSVSCTDTCSGGASCGTAAPARAHEGRVVTW